MQEILDRYRTGITGQQGDDAERAAAGAGAGGVRRRGASAGQDRERQKNEGQAYANDVIPKARGTAARLNEEAEGYRQRVIEQRRG